MRHHADPIHPFFVCIALVAAALVAPAFATDHSGTVGTETWTLTASPHHIIGNVTVSDGSTLTIEAGCDVRFNGNYELRVDGALIADGDLANHITFTSNQTTPSPGAWARLYFYGPDAGTVLDYCDISYGGSDVGGVYQYGAGPLSITNCTITHSANAGVYVYTAAPAISNCTISDNLGHGIQCYDTASDPVVSDCAIQDNGGWAVVTFGGNVKDYTGAMTITGNLYDAFLVYADDHVTGTWSNHGVPYVINGNLRVLDGQTLTIVPGDTLKFNGNHQFRVDGALIADGDPANHITFTSNQATPAPGDWTNLYFYGPDAGTVVDYCDISYGGSGEGGVYAFGAGPLPITNCSIAHNENAGIYVRAAAPTISNCTIQDNAHGIRCYDTASDPVVSDCTIQDNAGWAVITFGGNVKDYTGTMTIMGNLYDAFLVYADSHVAGTWSNYGVPYVINGNLTVQNTHTLTLVPGNTLKFNGNYELRVDGALIADGDPANHITFTSNQATPAPGDWARLYFYGPDGGTVVDYCDISYGGSGEGGVYNYGAGPLPITNCSISHNANAGIYVRGATPNISDCTISDNTGYGIQCYDVGSDPVVSDCTIQDNGGWAVGTFGGNVKDYTGTIVISGNGYDAFLVGGDTGITGTWLNHGVPYVVNGNLRVQNGQTLTIVPGDTLKFNGNYELRVDGALIADGDPANHITFTSNQATPAPGDWAQLYFYGPDGGTVVDYCDISYGGSGEGGVYSYGAGPLPITNCSIAHNANAGIYVRAASPSISNCTIADNAHGIRCYDTASDPVVSDCTIQDNAGWAVITFGGNVKDYTGTMTITGNLYDAFLVYADDHVTGTWPNHGVPYVINGNLRVLDGQTLTITPGDTLKFNGNYQLRVDGALIADGDPANHITFTSNQATPAPGDWMNLYFYGPDAGTVVDCCDISYGGSNVGAVYQYGVGPLPITNCAISHSATAGVCAESTSPTLASCVLEHNASAGIRYLGSAAPTLSDCTLQSNAYGVRGEGGTCHFAYNNQIVNNTTYGFYLTGACTATFGDTLSEWNDIYGNGTYDFYNGTSDIYAYYVYWGATDPSVISSHIWDDFDDTALGVVYFSHWLDATHTTEQSLTAPLITDITETTGAVMITWNPVPGALSYRMISSVRPWASYSVDVTGAFAGTTWSAPVNGDIRFYRVNAVAGSEVSAPSNIVGCERYPADIP